MSIAVAPTRSRRPPARSADGSGAGGAANARQSLSAMAYEALRTRLRGGQVGLQDRLVDLEIAAQLGVSRMPVREALLQLVAEGYLVSTARGYRIPQLNREDVQEVFELRLLLEPRAAALAARDIGRAGVARLKASLESARDAQSAGDFSNLFRANLDFRETWVGAVRNTRIATTISRYADQILTVRHSTLRDAGVHPVVVAGLEEQYRAFSRHDPVAAHDALLRFVLAAERFYFAAEAADAR